MRVRFEKIDQSIKLAAVVGRLDMSRRFVEHTECLDIREMRRNGKIPDGAQAMGVSHGGGPAINVQLAGRTRGQISGIRLYFCCPACARRCEVLYVRPQRLACRQCLKLAYVSENAGRLTRRVRRLQQLRERLGAPPESSSLGPFPRKPKWMRWATYERAVTRLAGRTAAHLRAPSIRLERLLARHAHSLK